MSNSSGEVIHQGKKIEEGSIPDWVESFLGKPFFEKCGKHKDVQKNDLNRYCVSCDAALCRYCIIAGHHFAHKVLTIYRHVYQNVVPLAEMENHMHCAKIQPYKCNKKWVVSLTPLPHNGSGSLIEGDGACHVCKRKLTDCDRFRFCSIACKVQSSSGKSMMHLFRPSHKKEEEQEVEEDEEDEEEEDEDEDEEEEEEEEVENLRKRSRKGVPHRAPSF